MDYIEIDGTLRIPPGGAITVDDYGNVIIRGVQIAARRPIVIRGDRTVQFCDNQITA